MSKRITLSLGLLAVLIFICATLGIEALANRASRKPDIYLYPTRTPVSQSQTSHHAAGAAAPHSGPITVKGSETFVQQTTAALTLLHDRAPEAYKKVQTYIGIIEETDHSGMAAYENPPRYEVSDKTAFYSLTWYASTIAHDATHSELYYQYRWAHSTTNVPDDAWTGIEIEKACNAYQLAVLKQIGGPASETDYLAGLDGTHCDVNHDGKCDAQDDSQRDW
jgi:hypothetical protein